MSTADSSSSPFELLTQAVGELAQHVRALTTRVEGQTEAINQLHHAIQAVRQSNVDALDELAKLRLHNQEQHDIEGERILELGREVERFRDEQTRFRVQLNNIIAARVQTRSEQAFG